VRVLAYTGLRFGEAAGLRVGSVDLVRGRLEVVDNVTEADGHLYEGSPKARRTRSVPVPRLLRAELAAHIKGKKPADRVFTTRRGRPLRNSNFRHHVFDSAVTRAGLAPLTPHDLRDTAASLSISAGANVKTIQRMLGHASAAMTLDIYAGLFDDDLDSVSACRMRPARTLRTQCGPRTTKRANTRSRNDLHRSGSGQHTGP
jgi:integrase